MDEDTPYQRVIQKMLEEARQVSKLLKDGKLNIDVYNDCKEKIMQINKEVGLNGTQWIIK
jgi:hypothetical protein